MSVDVSNPLSLVQKVRYARILRLLLRSLDREIVDAALIGESESDLLDTEREVVDSVREFLDGRVLVPFQVDGHGGRGLALLDAFGDECFAAQHRVSSRVRASELPTPGASGRTLEDAAGGGPSRGPSAAPSKGEER